ncbi:hypothetical protein ACSBLW_13985 [Thioclava sp. FR2]|uniref:hypothetical protein n=1 Tax=Thioclava sp. FR2 TaxID=3445780 RepID=UPI003EBE67AC
MHIAHIALDDINADILPRDTLALRTGLISKCKRTGRGIRFFGKKARAPSIVANIFDMVECGWEGGGLVLRVKVWANPVGVCQPRRACGRSAF